MFTEQDAPQHEFVFPESDLMLVLVDVYFRDMNSLFPLLHRPTFDRAIADGEHHRDSGFASVVLTVCAIASRMVRDPRVLLDGASGHSAGWKYFNQVPMARKSLLAPPSLYDVQTLCVSFFLLPRTSRDIANGTLYSSRRSSYKAPQHRRPAGLSSASASGWRRILVRTGARSITVSRVCRRSSGSVPSGSSSLSIAGCHPLWGGHVPFRMRSSSKRLLITSLADICPQLRPGSTYRVR
jgi:hypothetical protein